MGLKETITETQQAYRLDPGNARATCTTQSTLKPTFRSEVAIRQHQLTIDEPKALGGSDAGPNPIEVVLAALGSCQEITYRAFATALGIPIDNVSAAVEGDIDFRGFFGVDGGVRPGFDDIRVVLTIESSASDEELEKLRSIVDAHCPVLDMLQNPVPVNTRIKR